jgi:integrase
MRPGATGRRTIMWHRVWIHTRKTKKGKSYSIKWYDHRGRQHAKTVGSDRRLAERIRSEKEVALNSPEKELDSISYSDFVTEELDVLGKRLAASSVIDAKRALRYFSEICGPRTMADIDLAMVERFHSVRLGTVAKATANKELRTMKAAFTRAVRRGYLRENPGQYVKPVRVPQKALRVLSADDVGKLLDACPSDRWRAFVALAVTTGLRRGELMALRWCDVEIDALTVRVRNTPGHDTKSGKERAVPLQLSVVPLLRRLDHRGELIFHTETGTSMANNVERGFNAIVKRSGIERCTMHDLRRTFVSQLAMAGVNQAVVQQLAGHSSIMTTVKHYTQIMPDAFRSATDLLPFGDAIEAAGMLTNC